jgi:hypothetical protein
VKSSTVRIKVATCAGESGTFVPGSTSMSGAAMAIIRSSPQPETDAWRSGGRPTNA